MKRLCTIILLLFSLTVFTQTDTCFTQQEILNISNKIVELETKVNLQDDLVFDLKGQVRNYKTLASQDSTYVAYQKQEIMLLTKQINLYQDLYNQTKPKWYQSKVVWFISGASTILASSWVVSNIK